MTTCHENLTCNCLQQQQKQKKTRSMTQKLLAIAQAISMQLKNAFFALTRLKLQIMYNDDFKMLIERLW